MEIRQKETKMHVKQTVIRRYNQQAKVTPQYFLPGSPGICLCSAHNLAIRMFFNTKLCKASLWCTCAALLKCLCCRSHPIGIYYCDFHIIPFTTLCLVVIYAFFAISYSVIQLLSSLQLMASIDYKWLRMLLNDMKGPANAKSSKARAQSQFWCSKSRMHQHTKRLNWSFPKQRKVVHSRCAWCVRVCVGGGDFWKTLAICINGSVVRLCIIFRVRFLCEHAFWLGHILYKCFQML